MKFWQALRDMDVDGAHITRESWSGTDFVFAQRGYPEGIGVNQQTADALGVPAGTNVEFSAYLMRVWVDGPTMVAQPYTPSQEDMTADDWTTSA